MPDRTASRNKQDLPISSVEPAKTAIRGDSGSVEEQDEATQRRLMYERIAQGNALVEAEENARRKWCGK